MTKNNETTEKKFERLLSLDNGLVIYKTHLDFLREADKNARVMSPAMFERLAANIKGDGRLETMPLVKLHKNPAGNTEFLLISGHHRTRAARAAGVMEVYVLCIEDELSRSKMLAKQLSHNSLSGQDDPQMLRQIYFEIEDLNARLESGLADMEESLKTAVKIDEIEFKMDYEIINLFFLPHQKKVFEDAIDSIISMGGARR